MEETLNFVMALSEPKYHHQNHNGISQNSKRQNSKRINDLLNEKLFSKRWPPSHRNQTKYHLDTFTKMIKSTGTDTKQATQITKPEIPPWNGQ